MITASFFLKVEALRLTSDSIKLASHNFILTSSTYFIVFKITNKTYV